MSTTLQKLNSIRKYYVGYTADDLQNRFAKSTIPNHKGFGKNRGLEISVSQVFVNKTDALKRKNLLKQKSRSFIEKLIAGSKHPIYNQEEITSSNRSENRNKLMHTHFYNPNFCWDFFIYGILLLHTLLG